MMETTFLYLYIEAHRISYTVNELFKITRKEMGLLNQVVSWSYETELHF